MNWLLCIALLATPKPRTQPPQPASSAPPQLSQAEVRERVEAYLGSIDTPITPDNWRALGPQAADVLEPIANDPKAFPSERARALEGLIAAAPDRAAKLVGPLARDEKAPVVLRVAAMDGVSELLPTKSAISELKPVMQSAHSAGLRGAAGAALAKKKDACTEVRAQAAREKGDDRDAFRRALARCGE
jgi:hypothetical protein